MIYILKNVFSYETHAKKFLKINKYNYNYIYLFLRIFSHLIKTIKIINYVNNNFSEYVFVNKFKLSEQVKSFKYLYLKSKLVFKIFKKFKKFKSFILFFKTITYSLKLLFT